VLSDVVSNSSLANKNENIKYVIEDMGEEIIEEEE